MPAQAPQRQHRERLRRVRTAAWDTTKRTVVEFFEDGCTQHAAAISYYGLFSLFPLVILAVVGFGVVASEETVRERVIDLVEDNLPVDRGEGRAQLRDALEGVTDNPGAVGLGGLAGLLFAASGLMGAVRNALNAAWDASDEGRPFFMGKLVDVALVIAAGLVVTLSFALTLVTRLATRLDEELDGVGGAMAEGVLALGQLSPVLVSFVVFLFVYRVVPATDVALRDALPAALVAAVGFELLKTGFSVYVENFRDYSAVYGSIGAVIAFLFFVFIAANLFLLGAELGSELRTRRTRLRQRP